MEADLISSGRRNCGSLESLGKQINKACYVTFGLEEARDLRENKFNNVKNLSLLQKNSEWIPNKQIILNEFQKGLRAKPNK